jgi:LysM repeat protein
MPRIAGSLLAILMVAGCFQSNGSNLMPTDLSQIQPTYTLPPTDLPPPTEPPIVVTTVITVPQTLSPEDILAMQIAQQPTADDFALALTATAIFAPQQPIPTQPIAIDQGPLDPIAVTATYIVDRATQTASAPLTQAALAAGIGLPTAQPTFDPNAANGQPANFVPGADCIHEVRATDRNLYRIAMNYGLSIDQIAAASGIVNPDMIYVGQKLTIPGCGVTGARPLPTSTPRGGIATSVPQTVPQTVVTPPIGMTFTPIPTPGASSAGASSVGGQVHIVRQGETLFQISMQYGVPVVDIAAANGISNINLIYLGQTLTIP